MGAKKKLTHKDIMEKVDECFGNKWKSETVCAFIGRLRKKGYLYFVKEGRYAYNEASVNFDVYRNEQLQELIDRFYEGNKRELMKDIIDED